MYKKLLSIFLAVIMVLTIVPLTAFAQDDISDYLNYDIVDGEVTITGFHGYNIYDLEIPDTIEGYPVTVIDRCALDNLKSVTIPDSVKIINESAFKNCHNLEAVTIGNGVKVIGEQAFAECTALKAIVIPDSVKIIGNSAFELCGNLANITLGKGVTTIGTLAFCECNKLKSIFIPANLEAIGIEAFTYCGSLEKFDVDENNRYFSSNEDGVLFNKDKTILRHYPAGNSKTEYDIPYGVETIEFAAFTYSTKLKSVTIPDSVKTIGSGAFGICTSLEEIIIPDSVTSTIGEAAFVNCVNLKKVVIGNGVTGIEDSAFYGCPRIEDLVIGKNVRFIGRMAFLCDVGNFRMKSLTIPENVESIGPQAFYCLQALEEINIYNPELIIEDEAFYTIGILDMEKYTALADALYTNRERLFDCDTDLDSRLMEEILNIAYEIPEDELKGIVIYGYIDSTAELFAEENNYPFEDIEQKEIPDNEEEPSEPEKPSENEGKTDEEVSLLDMLKNLLKKLMDFFSKLLSSLGGLFT